MSEQRETANAGMQQVIPGFDGRYRFQQGERFLLLQKFCTLCKISVTKDKRCTMLPQANRVFIG
jgi:hypothetical protein